MSSILKRSSRWTSLSPQRSESNNSRDGSCTDSILPKSKLSGSLRLRTPFLANLSGIVRVTKLRDTMARYSGNYRYEGCGPRFRLFEALVGALRSGGLAGTSVEAVSIILV